MSLKDSTPNSADAYLLRLRAALVGFPDSGSRGNPARNSQLYSGAPGSCR
jgi:hypothetical protein